MCAKMTKRVPDDTQRVVCKCDCNAMPCDALLLCGGGLWRHGPPVSIVATATGGTFPYMEKVH